MFPFFQTGYTIVVAMTALYVLLGVASLSVKLVSRGSSPGMLSQQINAWWRIFPIVTLALLAYPFGILLLASLICLLALLELAPYFPGRGAVYWGAVATLVLVMAIVEIWRPSAAPAVWCALLIAQCALFATRPRASTLIALGVAVTLAAMVTLARFPVLLRESHLSLAWLFYLFVLTALNDIGQFVSGKLFGKHRLAPKLSPNKTWEGLAGGIVMSVLVSLGLGSYLTLAAHQTLIWFAVLLSVGGLLGDLMFSAAKRYLSIKDFSSLIPGHGGILDRADSLVVTAPLLYFLLSGSR